MLYIDAHLHVDQQTTPLFLKEMVKKIADLQGVEELVIRNKCRENVLRLYRK